MSETPRTDAAERNFGEMPGLMKQLERELAAARAELALHEDNARQSLEEIEALRANFTEWSCIARAFEDERDQARAELAKAREILLNVGLSPNHHPGTVKAAEGASSIISELRRTLSDPPPDVQEAVLTKLGIYEQLSELAALRAEQATPQWLPIESAPRDGIQIITLERIKDRWFASHDHWTINNEWMYGTSPTHWMPLPAAPPRDLNEHES